MANLTKSWKAQTMNLFGPAPTERWGKFTWGVNTWGAKAPVTTGLPTLFIQINKVWSKSNTITVSEPNPPSRNPNKVWSGSNRITFSAPLFDIEVKNGIYNEVFRDHTTNFASSPMSIYTVQTVSGVTYVTLSAQGTVWS